MKHVTLNTQIIAAKISALPSHFKYIKREYKNILQYFLAFFFLDQINAALVSIRDNKKLPAPTIIQD